MINHARTLLMNIDGSSGFLGTPGDEIIDPDFRSRVMSGSMQAIRRVLFGVSPSRNMLNYRCRELLGLIHGTAMEEYITDMDRRVTYDFKDDQLFSRISPAIVNTGGHNHTLTIGGSTTFAGSQGLIESEIETQRDAEGVYGMYSRVWNVISGGNDIRFTHTAEDGTGYAGTSASGTLSIELSPSGVMASHDDAPSSTAWTVTILSRPTEEMGTLVTALDNIGENYLLDLFEIADPVSKTEPLKSLYRIWKDHNELAYRLGAVTIALILKIDKAVTA